VVYEKCGVEYVHVSKNFQDEARSGKGTGTAATEFEV
jgi:hypothetical protein